LLPQTNIRFGSRYLKRLSTQFSGKLALVAAAYNAGPHRVVGWVKSWGRLDADEFVEQIPYLQTRNYVKKVSHNYVIYNALTLNLTEPKNLGWLAAPISLNFEGPVPTKESWDDIGG
jgi:soluble lytic murein transglycosylase